MQETAYAKINLALHVRERRADGYHRIETVFAFAEDGDRLDVAAAQDLTLEIIGPFAADLAGEGDNLVLRAARALRDRCGVETGARLTLDKRLPIASGIGGGSADAAAALRLLARWWHLDASEAELLDIAARLGADVPACLLSRTARGEGKGDDLEPLPVEDLAGTPLLLVNPASILVDGCRVQGLGRRRSRAARRLAGRAQRSRRAGDRSRSGDRRCPGSAEGRRVRPHVRFGRNLLRPLRDCRGPRPAAARLAAAHPDWWILASQLR